jgi:poly-gamma-glutamate capsule biosynthesis protein CapA/YwtB (metallophosphatase superfamily)
MKRMQIHKRPRLFLYGIILGIVLLLGACNQKADINNTVDNQEYIEYDTSPSPTIAPSITAQAASEAPSEGMADEPAMTNNPQKESYCLNPDGASLETRINPPPGYSRVSSSSGELVDFLRKLPMREANSDVLLYNGRPKGNQSDHIAVFDISLSDRDLQQCADSVIRIYAEYYWSIQAYDKIAFHLTNGFLMEYEKWRDGNRIKVNGNKVSWVKTAAYNASYDEFLNYLNMVFAYAGTLSLVSECESIQINELKPGDLFLQGGSPGHCVMVIDMATDSTGNPCYLLAQGYMPAQDFHVLKNPLHTEDPWYYSSELTFPLATPAWRFNEGSAVRWGDFSLSGLKNETLNASASIESVPTWSSSADSIRNEDASQVTLLAVGDNLIHREVIASGLSPDGSYHYDHLYSNLKDEISSADLAIVNQETIFGGNNSSFSGYPKFNSPTQIGDALVDVGFDIILHATNHTMDMGLEGVENTIAYWKTKPGITILGINETEEASNQVPILTKNGIKLAMLNYTYGLNGIPLPKDKPYLVNLLDKKKMKADLEYAEANADFTIVFPHWGSEYSFQVSQMQKELTEFFYEQGVDLIIGCHPHVIEPVEWVETEPGHRMLVCYSLGNFLSYQREAERMLGAMAAVTIVKDDHGTYISNASITPIVTHYENGPRDYHYAIYKLTDYTPELAKLHGVSDIAQKGPFDYHKTISLTRQVLGDWFVEKEELIIRNTPE